MTKHAQSEVDAAAADLLLHLQASVSLADRPIFKKGRARTSSFRGVTKHRFSSKYEAHLWDNSWVHESGKKGKQVYLGGYDTEEKAATTYDLAALKYWGPSPTLYLNFPGRDYSKELEQMKTMTRTDYITHLKRNSSGFSRGASKYRGVTRHHCEGRWQARIGRDKGSNDIYLGTFASEKEAAEAYDIAAIKLKGVNAVTNFHVSSYDVEEIEKSTLPFERPKQNKRKEAAELATMEFTAPAPAFEFRMQQQEVGDQVMMQIQAQPETNGYLQAILVQEDKVPAQAESHAQADVYPYSYPQVMTQIQAQPESNGYLQTSLGQEDQVTTQSESHAQANGYPYNYPQVMMQVQAQLQTNAYRQPLLGMKSQAPTQAQAQTQAHRYPYFYPQVIMQFQKEPQTDYYPQAVLEQEFQAPTQARAQEQAQDQRYPPATLTVGYPWQYPVFFYPVVNYSPYRP